MLSFRLAVAIAVVVLAPRLAHGADAVLIAKSKAKAALSLGLAADGDSADVIQSAKSRAQAALGAECDCGNCGDPQPMPAAAVGVPVCKPATVERVSYAALRSIVQKLKPGETIRVFDRKTVVQSCDYSGTIYVLTDGIPGQSAGVWRCFRPLDGEPSMQLLHLPATK